jgi:predicted N-acetyltransferase YhbS
MTGAAARSFVVRPERPEDRERSLEVERAAFGDDVEATIVEAVRDETGSFALVAEERGSIVGHVQLSRAWIGGDAVLALGPIAVLPVRQRHGIGRALMDAAAEEAARRDEIAVILLGDPLLYPRFGYLPAADFGLRNPFAGVREGDLVVAEEDFMILPLDERARDLAGDVRWHAAFGQAEDR